MGLHVFDDDFSTTNVELVDQATTITLKAPKTTTKPIAQATYEKVEIGEKEVGTKAVTAGDTEKTALGLTSSDVVSQDIKVNYNPIKEASIPDQFQVTFSTTGPTSMVKDGDFVFNYLSFREKDSSDPWVTVGCVTKIGDKLASEIISWESPTEFDSTTQTGKSIA